MQFASVVLDGRPTWGVCADGSFHDLGGVDARFDTLRAFIESGSVVEPDPAAARRPLDDVEFLPVVPDPRQIFCVGLNYEEHRIETQRPEAASPTIFLRLAASQIGHGAPLVKPRESERFDYEGELAVVIGRGGRRISVETATEHVFGYACYNDGTARDWQSHTSQWTPGKNFPATGAFGPYLVTADEVPDISSSYLRTFVNGEERQSAQIADMTTPIADVIAYISTFVELLPGDVICTGTPGGVGSRRTPPSFLIDGDVVRVSIDGVGVLENSVVAEA